MNKIYYLKYMIYLKSRYNVTGVYDTIRRTAVENKGKYLYNKCAGSVKCSTVQSLCDWSGPVRTQSQVSVAVWCECARRFHVHSPCSFSTMPARLQPQESPQKRPLTQTMSAMHWGHRHHSRGSSYTLKDTQQLLTDAHAFKVMATSPTILYRFDTSDSR